MIDDALTHMVLQVSLSEDAAEEEIDNSTRQLLAELRDLTEVQEAHLASAGQAPSGTKSVDPVTLGALAVVVLPTFLPKLVEFVQAWALRGQNRSVKFKGKMSGQDIEFEGSAQDFKAVLAALEQSGGRPSGAAV